MRRLQLFALVLASVTPLALPARSALVAIKTQCAGACADLVSRIAATERQKYPVLDLAPETFEPAAQPQCKAREASRPVIHATILAPYYDRFRPLPGTQNDALLWSALLAERGAEVTQLKGNAVTRQSMIDAMRDAVGCVRERDLVVLAFSGDAASPLRWSFGEKIDLIEDYCVSPAGAQNKGCDPAVRNLASAALKQALQANDELVLFSSDVNIVIKNNRLDPETAITGLRGSELSNFVTQVRNRGGDVVLILDTNYAEGLDIVAEQNRASPGSTWKWQRGAVETDNRPPLVELFGSGEVAAFYAAKSDQWATESPKTGGLQLGALTFAMTEALRAIPSPTIEQLARETDRIMRQDTNRQIPVFEATDPAMLFLSTREPEPANPGDIDIIHPKMRGAAVIPQPELEVVARYSGPGKARFASIDGVNVEIDPSGQFRRSVVAEQRLEVPIRIYGDRANILAERRLQFDVDAAKATLAPAGRRFALIIGNEDYENFDRLDNPIDDAEAVRDLLVGKFGFSTTIETSPGKTRDLFLNNATAMDIKRVLSDLRKTLIAEDQLVVYYAGHGMQDSESMSYWVPVDGTDEDFTWISSSEISNDLRRLASGSVLLISDSCYAGGLSRSGDASQPPPQDARDRYLAKASQYKARQLIASGGDEPVQDGGGGSHSLFARALLEGLTEMPEQVFTASELFNNKIKPKAIEFAFNTPTAQGQTPVYFRMTRAGDQPEAEFIFVRQ